MSKEELSFKELPDGSKIITIQGINQFGEKYIRQEMIKCPSVWDALKRLTYTADDMEAFAEWCSFKYEFNPFFNKWRKSDQTFKHFVDNIDNAPTTIQLREMWEQEGGEK